MFRKKKPHVHFIGIGGAGMSGLAEILLTLGYPVSGSDIKNSSALDRLNSAGAITWHPHLPEKLPTNIGVGVYSSAVHESNPEILALKKKNIPLISRGEMLAEIMRIKHGIAIAGTHGKTTTSSLTGAVLMAGKLDPSIYVGGRVQHLDGNIRVGRSDFFIAESDESDGSFLKLSPTLAVITNIDNDHINYYGSLDKLKTAFYQFADRIPFYGELIYCWDDLATRELFSSFARKKTSYGISGGDLKAENIRDISGYQHFLVNWGGKILGEARIQSPGKHNILNALAAIGVGLSCEIPFNLIVEGLAQFTGVDRRFQLVGNINGAPVIDDYAHHPTEMQATILAAKSRYPNQKIWAIFQPHRFTRTKDCWEQFPKAFESADHIIITDVYAASETALPEITGKTLVDFLKKKHAHVIHENDFEKIAQTIRDQATSADVVLILGAGNITQLKNYLK